MSNKESKNRRVALGLMIALGLCLSVATAWSARTTSDLKLQMEEIDAQLIDKRVDIYTPYEPPPPQQELRDKRADLAMQSYDSEQATGYWICAILAYAIIFFIAGFFISFVKKLNEPYGFKNAQGPNENAVPTSDRFATATQKIRNAMPRQPAIGGQLSAADELRKWRELRDDGLVTEEEFTQMRKRLLG